jgi:pilus assembly protein Flp/PilA
MLLNEMKMKWIRKFFRDDSGASAMEYAILIGLIATVIIIAVAIFGSSVKELFSNANGIFNK